MSPMGPALLAILAGGLLLAAPCACPEAAIYGYVDSDGVAHFTDAPTKPQFRPLPAFGLPRGTSLTSGPYAELIDAAASEQRVDPALVKAIIRAESNFNQRAVSKKGAQGLMQLMPDTAFRYAVRNSFDPAENIRGGVQYLRFLHDTFPGQLSLVVAAYNAGENAVLRHGGIPPYRETQEYVRRVLRFYGRAEERPTAVPVRTPRPPEPATPPAFPPPADVHRQVAADGTVHYTNVPPLGSPRAGAPR